MPKDSFFIFFSFSGNESYDVFLSSYFYLRNTNRCKHDLNRGTDYCWDRGQTDWQPFWRWTATTISPPSHQWRSDVKEILASDSRRRWMMRCIRYESGHMAHVVASNQRGVWFWNDARTIGLFVFCAVLCFSTYIDCSFLCPLTLTLTLSQDPSLSTGSKLHFYFWTKFRGSVIISMLQREYRVSLLGHLQKSCCPQQVNVRCRQPRTEIGLVRAEWIRVRNSQREQTVWGVSQFLRQTHGLQFRQLTSL